MIDITNFLFYFCLAVALVSLIVAIVFKVKGKKMKTPIKIMVYALVLSIVAGGTSYVVRWTSGEYNDNSQVLVSKKDESECTAEFTSWEKYAADVFADYDTKITYSQGMITVDYQVSMDEMQTDKFVKACKAFTDEIEKYGDGADRLPALNGGLFKWKRGSISVFFSLNDNPRVTPKLMNYNDFEDTQEIYEKYFEN